MSPSHLKIFRHDNIAIRRRCLKWLWATWIGPDCPTVLPHPDLPDFDLASLLYFLEDKALDSHLYHRHADPARSILKEKSKRDESEPRSWSNRDNYYQP